MAYTAMTVQRVNKSGAALAYTSTAGDGLKFSNDGATYVDLWNNGASSATVTISTPNTYQGLAVDDITVSLTAGQHKIAGPFPTELFNVASGTDAGCIRLVAGGTGAADIDAAAFQ